MIKASCEHLIFIKGAIAVDVELFGNDRETAVPAFGVECRVAALFSIAAAAACFLGEFDGHVE